MSRGEQVADAAAVEVALAEEIVSADDAAMLDGTLQLASGVLHDLRNSIGYITSNVSPLGQYFEDLLELLEVYAVLEEGLSQEERDYLTRFKSAIDFDDVGLDIRRILDSMNLGSSRSSSLIDEMRVLFVPGTRLVRRPANPVEASSQSMQVFRDRFSPEVEFVFADSSSVDEVGCPKTAFIRVLDNLLSNAVHACRGEAGARVAVDLTLSSDGKVLIVSVTDNGVGIPDHIKPRLFEPYFTTRDADEGTGIGLAIVRRIVRDYGGELSFDSVEGKGTTFRFTIPLSTSRRGD